MWTENICGFFLNEANIFIFFYFFLKVNMLEFRQDVAQKDTNSKVESPPDKVDKMSKPRYRPRRVEKHAGNFIKREFCNIKRPDCILR